MVLPSCAGNPPPSTWEMPLHTSGKCHGPDFIYYLFIHVFLFLCCQDTSLTFWGREEAHY